MIITFESIIPKLVEVIKLPNELDHQRKDWISIQNIDENEYFKWGLFTYLHTADRNPERAAKSDKDFAKIFYFKTQNFH